MAEPQTVCFGPFVFEPHQARLRRGRRVLPLTRKACEVLHYLATHPGQLVTKEALFQAVWPDTAVSDAVLTNRIAELREALGDDANRPRFIATVHRRGYRFIAALRTSPPAFALATPRDDRARTIVRPTPQPALPVVVGREAALAHLHDLYTAARNGQRRVAFVTGEAGIGKTALVETFEATVWPESGLWLGHGQCIEQYGAGEAYLPLLEALDRLCRGPEGDRLVALLTQYAPSWIVQLPGLLSASALADLQRTLAGTTQARMLRELCVALEAVSAEQALVLVLEDLHWSDHSTIEVLAMLARRREPARLLVVGTYRAAEVVVREHPLQTMKRELVQQGRAVEVALSYLSPAAVHEYVTARLADHDAADALAPVVYRRTDGHPLFMVEVTDYLVQERSRLPATSVTLGSLEQALPPGLRELIAAQLERLSAEEQQVLKVASVAGVEFAVASVAVGLQGAPDAIEAVCERLARRALFLEERELATWPDGTVSGRYAFRHGLYQEVLYHGLTSGLRARLHQQIGDRQERAYGEQAREVAAELAMHFERGQDYPRAVRHLRQAAEHATRRHAPHEVIGLVTKALELLATLAETPARAQQELDLLLVLGPAVQVTKGSAAAEVEQVYTRARLLCAQHGETSQLFLALGGLWRVVFNRGSYRTALELGKQLEELAHRTVDPRHPSAAHAALALTLLYMGEYMTAQSHCEQGVALIDATARRVAQPHAVRATLLAIDALIKWCLGYPAQALRRSQQALAEAQAASPYDLAFAQSYAASLHCRRRDFQAVLAHADALLSLATTQGFPLWMANAAVWRGWGLVMQGQHATGLAQIRQGMKEAWATGDTGARPRHLRLLAEALGHAGEVHTGLGLLIEALEQIETVGPGDLLSETHRLHGVLLLQQDVPDPVRAETCFQQALIIAREQQAKAWELRAAVNLSRLWQQQGKRAQAYELLAPIYGWFTEGFDTADLQEARALLAELA